MLGTLKSIYYNIEPNKHEKESVESAKVQVRKELAESKSLSQEYLKILLSQLKYLVKTNLLFYVVDISELLNFFKDVFQLEDPAEIIRM